MLTGQIFIQLIVILLVVQAFGTVCKYIGQPKVVGEILGGLALGPALLGAISPQIDANLFPSNTLPTLQTLGDIGLVLYMFSMGMHIDTQDMLKRGHKAMVVSLSGILIPLLLGGILAYFLFPDFGGSNATILSFTLLVGTAMAITAFPVLARLLEERQMLTSSIGTLALLCAAITDIVGWCLLAFITMIIHSTGITSVLMMLGLLILFIVVMLAVVRPLLLWSDRHLRSKPTQLVLVTVLLLMSAYATNAIGIHPVFGAFMMGMILPRHTTAFKQVQNIEQLNTILFLPLYFVYNGLRVHIGLINSPALWLLVVLVLIVACLGKILGGTLSLKLFGSSWHRSLTLGTLLNTRGLVELILLNIALDLKVITPTLFAILVIMAIATTMMAPPLLFLLGYRQTKAQKQKEQKQAEHETLELSENNAVS